MVFFIRADQAKSEVDHLSRFFSARPEGQLFGTGKIKSSGIIAPVIGGILPGDPAPTAAGGVLDFQTIAVALARVRCGASVVLDRRGSAHPTGGNIAGLRLAIAINYQRKRYLGTGVFAGGHSLPIHQADDRDSRQKHGQQSRW